MSTTAAHPVESRSRDQFRDNAAIERGDHVARYGWVDVVPDPCATAAQLARMFQAAGWREAPKACRRKKCLIGKLYRRGPTEKRPRS
jgi:hypothetical protein